ncbi:MAG: hypothetical protein ABH865_02810 [Candidatus Omnitrophota bacterium]|nr:hypothetical protein [Candidatus Omnitrophota bacterium]
MKIIIGYCIILLLSSMGLAHAQNPKPEQYQAIDNYINDVGDGSDFDKAVMLADSGNYASCDSDQCAREEFRRAVFADECAYITERYGKQNQDWRIVGQDNVSAYVFGLNTYYDDLGIEITATGKRRVIRFNITGPVESVKHKLGLRWDDDL